MWEFEYSESWGCPWHGTFQLFACELHPIQIQYVSNNAKYYAIRQSTFFLYKLEWSVLSQAPQKGKFQLLYIPVLCFTENIHRGVRMWLKGLITDRLKKMKGKSPLCLIGRPPIKWVLCLLLSAVWTLLQTPHHKIHILGYESRPKSQLLFFLWSHGPYYYLGTLATQTLTLPSTHSTDDTRP